MGTSEAARLHSRPQHQSRDERDVAFDGVEPAQNSLGEGRLDAIVGRPVFVFDHESVTAVEDAEGFLPDLVARSCDVGLDRPEGWEVWILVLNGQVCGMDQAFVYDVVSAVFGDGCICSRSRNERLGVEVDFVPNLWWEVEESSHLADTVNSV